MGTGGGKPRYSGCREGLGGYSSIGAILVGRKFVDVLNAGTAAFVHGHTYQAHPVACAAALEVQRIIREERLLTNVKAMEAVLAKALREQFAEHQYVGDIRGRGLFQAIEFVSDAAARTPFARDIHFSERLKANALALGLAIYPNGGAIDGQAGDHVIIAPPYNVTPAQIDLIVALLGDAVDRTVSQLSQHPVS